MARSRSRGRRGGEQPEGRKEAPKKKGDNTLSKKKGKGVVAKKAEKGKQKQQQATKGGKKGDVAPLPKKANPKRPSR